MRDKLYQAFHADIEYVDCAAIDEWRDTLLALRPYTQDEKQALRNYNEAFLVRFTYESNALEGSTLTLGETAFVLEGEFTPTADSSLRDIFAARGCADGDAFMRRMLQEQRPLSEDLIKDVHERVALDCQPATRGVYRMAPAYIIGSATTPAAPLEIRPLMADLVFMYEESNMHPVAKAAAFHAMFEHVHPFSDGNGRTGRVILNFMLEKAGYCSIALKHDAKGDYKKSLERWQVEGDPASFFEIVSSCLKSEYRERVRIIEETRRAVRALGLENRKSEGRCSNDASAQTS